MISWQADDPDGDKLVYEVAFRGEGERDWKLLKKDLHESSLTIDGDALADGRYFFKVTASDREANPPAAAKEADLTSSPVLIDNTPPVIRITSNKRTGAALPTSASKRRTPLRRCAAPSIPSTRDRGPRSRPWTAFSIRRRRSSACISTACPRASMFSSSASRTAAATPACKGNSCAENQNARASNFEGRHRFANAGAELDSCGPRAGERACRGRSGSCGSTSTATGFCSTVSRCRRRKPVYVLLYKPAGYITTFKDPEGRPTVYDLITDVDTFVSPVGRLDLDTSGLLILTNDTQFAERLTNPDHKIAKTYLVEVRRTCDR